MSGGGMMEMLEKGQLKLPSVLLDAKVIDLNRWSTLVTDQSLALLASKNMKRMSDVMAKRNKGTRPPPVDVDLHHPLRARALIPIIRAMGACACTACLLTPTLSRAPLPSLNLRNVYRDRSLHAFGTRVFAIAHPPFTSRTPVTGGRGARVSITTLTKSSLEANDALDQSVSEVHIAGAEITDYGLKKLSDGCRDLVTLDISKCRNVSDVGVRAIAMHSTRLEVLKMAGVLNVVESGIVAIGTFCKELRHLDLAGCRTIDEWLLTRLADGCPHLQVLNLNRCRVSNEVLKVRICMCEWGGW